MTIPRRRFLHLAAGAAALPTVSRALGRKLIQPIRCASLAALPPAARMTLSRA